MAEYDIHVSQEAKKHLKQISDYIATELVAPQAALDLLDEFETKIESLTALPKRAPLCHEYPWHDKGVRYIVVKNYMVYFVVNDNTLKVNILAVAYAKRNQAAFLKEMVQQILKQ